MTNRKKEAKEEKKEVLTQGDKKKQNDKMMSGQVNLKVNGILDEDLPTLLENVFKCLSKHLDLVYMRNEFNNEIRLRDDIVIPNEICDRFVYIQNKKTKIKKQMKQTCIFLFCFFFCK